MAKGVSELLYKGIMELEPTALLEFYIIYYDYEENPADWIAIHAGSNGIGTPLYWQGVLYRPFNIKGTSWELSNDQRLPRPHITVSNKGAIVSTLLRKYKNLNGAKVIRKRTLARFIDDANFPNGANPYGAENFNAGFPDEKYYISHVVSENKQEVEFELITPLELENQKIPNRKVHSLRCGWVYRGYGCRYAGPPIADQTDKLLVDLDRNESPPAEFKMSAFSDFEDTSKHNWGDFSALKVKAASAPYFSNGVGLYCINSTPGYYPEIVTDKYLPHSESQSAIYFNGTGVVCLSTGKSTFSVHEPNVFHPSGKNFSSRSISFFVYPESGGGYEPTGLKVIYDGGNHTQAGVGIGIIGSGHTGSGQFIAVIRTSGNAWDHYPTGWEVFVGGENIWNRWNHICLTYSMGRANGSGNVGRLYVNNKIVASGFLDTETTVETRLAAIPTEVIGIGGALGASVFINKWYSYSDTFIDDAHTFRGWFDDLRIFDRVISASEVYNIRQGQDLSLLTQQNITNQGEWDSTYAYGRGDAVFIEGKKYKIFSNKTKDGFEGIKFGYLCVGTGNVTTDPRTDSSNWLRDSCSKGVHGCSLRYGNVLPFGGFPGTHRYPFSARQNGY